MTPTAPQRQPPPRTPTAEELARMSLMEHLEELRKRIFYTLIALFVAFIPCWVYVQKIFDFLAAPLQRIQPGLRLAFLGLTDPFILYFKVAALSAVFVAATFLLGMGHNFQAVITIEKYFGFLLTVILGLGLMFELPVLILLLSLIGVVTPRFLLRYFRHAVVIIFIVAAIITPTPDVVNLCIFAVPALGLYLLGVGAAFFAERFRKKKQVEMAEDVE